MSRHICEFYRLAFNFLAFYGHFNSQKWKPIAGLKLEQLIWQAAGEFFLFFVNQQILLLFGSHVFQTFISMKFLLNFQSEKRKGLSLTIRGKKKVRFDVHVLFPVSFVFLGIKKRKKSYKVEKDNTPKSLSEKTGDMFFFLIPG